MANSQEMLTLVGKPVEDGLPSRVVDKKLHRTSNASDLVLHIPWVCSSIFAAGMFGFGAGWYAHEFYSLLPSTPQSLSNSSSEIPEQAAAGFAGAITSATSSGEVAVAPLGALGVLQQAAAAAEAAAATAAAAEQAPTASATTSTNTSASTSTRTASRPHATNKKPSALFGTSTSASVLSSGVSMSWAILVAGQLRSFTLERTWSSNRRFLIDPLSRMGGVDMFYVVDESSRTSELSATLEFLVRNMPVRGWRAVASSGKWRSYRAKVIEGVRMMVGMEALHGVQYTFVITTRPDLQFLQPVRADLLRNSSHPLFTYDMMAHCPRKMVTTSSPCAYGLSDFNADLPFWHFRMGRSDPSQTELEFWLMSPANLVKHLGDLSNTKTAVSELASCTLTALAFACRRYDHYLEEIVRDSVALGLELSVVGDIPFPADAVAARVEQTAAYRIYKVAKQGNTTPLGDLKKYIGSVNALLVKVIDHAGAANTRTTRKAGFQAMKPGLEEFCPVRFFHCGAGSRHAESAKDQVSVADFARELCLRGFQYPRWGRAFFYHNPAGRPHLGQEAKQCLNGGYLR